ncbi:MAG: hypothetical protein KCHDKBKB_00744 [Elusimicrobia bacterium]|nr:hypothetical protein [Elusimicrobiota bacterium]
MAPTIDGEGRITDWKRVFDFQGKVLSNGTATAPTLEPTKLAGIDFTTLLSPYKDRKVKITIDVQQEG